MFCIAVILTLIGVACVLVGRTKKSADTLVVGMMSGWPPFMSINARGEFEGFDVDIAQAIAQKLGKKLEIIDTGSLAPLFVSLEQEKIDLILSGLDITPKRRQELAMIQYTGDMIDTFALVFWEKVPTGITTMQDLCTLKNPIVCYEPGSSIDDYIKQFEFIDQKPLSQTSEVILDIKYGKSTAGMLDSRVAAQAARQNPEIKVVQIPLPADYQLYGMGIALKKENTTLKQNVERIITELKQDGTIKKLELLWKLEE